jgi:hypothetical protein
MCIRAKGREDWLKLRQQRTKQSSRDPNDRSAEKDQVSKDLSGTPDRGLDDDLNWSPSNRNRFDGILDGIVSSAFLKLASHQRVITAGDY